MGVVYKAEDTNLQRTVALIFLSLDVIGDDELRKRFINEARTADEYRCSHSVSCPYFL